MACALDLACAEREVTAAHMRALRDYLFEEICSRIPDVRINGDQARRLPGNANFSFARVHGESLLVGLDLAGIMASSGSACTSGSLEPSHVLQALGLPEVEVQASLRLTIGRDNTLQEMERTVEVLTGLVDRLRSLAPAARSS
jgi:cysteine desulfurase